jgi:hypothetical protein
LRENDLCDVHALRVRGQVADLHIIDHSTAKRAHGQFLCEMDSATWRQCIVSRLSCQTGGRRRRPAGRQLQSNSWLQSCQKRLVPAHYKQTLTELRIGTARAIRIAVRHGNSLAMAACDPNFERWLVSTKSGCPPSAISHPSAEQKQL